MLHLRMGLLCLAVTAIVTAGCTSPSTGSASVYVKDAPTDEFDEIHVVFTKIQVHASNASENGTGWVTLFDNATGVDVDLLNASGTQAAFLGEADLQTGRYTQLRVTVMEAYGVKDDQQIALTLSSGTLKLNHPFTIAADKETRLVLDFDLDRSLHQQGNGAWRMTPVVGQVLAEVVEDDASGEEAGQEAGDIETVA